jgi:flagellum-specific peptidoglycan hydrolase FlgJ/cell wall-associated NlpC family hydrolase
MVLFKKTVSVLTAAGLVAAPIGGVAINAVPAYAADGSQHIATSSGASLPQSYSEVESRIKAGETFTTADFDIMTSSEYGFLTTAQKNALKALQTDVASAKSETKEETSSSGNEAAKVSAASENTGADTTNNETTEEAGTQVEENETIEGETTPDASGSAQEGNGSEENDIPEANTPDAGTNPSEGENGDGSMGEGENGDGEAADPTDPVDPVDPTDPVDPSTPDTTPEVTTPTTPEVSDSPVADPGPAGTVQRPQAGGAGGVTDKTHTAAVIKGEAQTPIRQQASKVASISFTHIDNSAYVARHYTEDLTTEKFITLIGESARTVADENDLYASVMIAQAILESASGNSTLAQAPNNNLFGIKGSYNGNSVSLQTREDNGSGATYVITADFRQYENIEESLADYADLLSNSMGDFYAGARKSHTNSFVDACDFLVGRYATDIYYSQKLQDLIETYDLTRFDVPQTYELTDVYVAAATDADGNDLYLDPVADQEEYEKLVAEYEAYLARTQDYQQALEEWEAQKAAAEDLYNVPVYLEKPEMQADTEKQAHQNAVDEKRFEGFAELIEAGEPLPVREERTLTDLTTYATSFLGLPYVWGGSTPAGFDCSGLVQYCYQQVFGVTIPRTTYYQCEVGEEVSFDDLRAGDLVFFERDGDVYHVGMYLGDGYYIEAPQTGDVVKITAMSDKMPSFAKRILNSRDIDLSEYTDEELAKFVERESYLQEREERLGISDEALEELTEWLQSLEF